MEAKIIEEILIFAGRMATLGCLTKIVLAVINRRRPELKSGNTLDEMAQRLGRMEQAIDATAVEVERISEAQRFTTKLLVDKGHQGQVEGSRARVVTPH